jgi:hypothetical protein
MNRTKLILAIAAGFVLFLGITTWLMIGNRKNRVEVCMSFQGRQACKAASGETKEASFRTATDTACALIASGVTDTQACTRGEPVSVRWLD